MTAGPGRTGAVRGAMTVAIGVGARASNQAVTFVVTLVAMRYLDPATFGVFSLAAVTVTVIRTLLYAGAFEHLLKTPDAGGEATEALAINLGLALILSVIAAIGAVVARFFDAGSQVAWLLLLLLPTNLLSAIAAWRESLLLRSSRIQQYYLATFAVELASMAVAVGLFLAGFGLMALVGQVYARSVLALLVYTLIGRAEWSADFSTVRAVAIMRWSLPRYGSVLLTQFSSYAADIALGIFLSPAATGLYRASSRLVGAVADVINQPTRLIGMTLVSARAKAGRESATFWPLVFTVAAVAGWAALAGLAGVAGLAVPLMMGHNWAGAVPIVAILCAARALTVLDASITPALVAYNHQKPLLAFQCVSAVALVVLVALMAPRGVVPATLAVLLAAMVNSALMLNLARRRLPGSAATLIRHLPLALLPAGLTLAAALLCRAAIAQVALSPMAALATVVVAGAAGWLVALAILRRPLSRVAAGLRGEADRDADDLHSVIA